MQAEQNRLNDPATTAELRRLNIEARRARADAFRLLER
jgi:hypothetical protein